MADDAVYILDELELRPGMLEPFRQALAAQYLPGAQKRGMQLLHTWVTPPVELEAGGTQVLLVWQLSGVPGFWGMRGRNASADIAAWWRNCDEFVVSRSRRYAAEAEALPRLEASARANA